MCLCTGGFCYKMLIRVDPVHLFLSLSSETEFELKKLSSAVGHCRSPYRQWQATALWVD